MRAAARISIKPLEIQLVNSASVSESSPEDRINRRIMTLETILGLRSCHHEARWTRICVIPARGHSNDYGSVTIGGAAAAARMATEGIATKASARSSFPINYM